MEYTVLKIDLDIDFNLFMRKYVNLWEYTRRIYIQSCMPFPTIPDFSYVKSNSGFVHVYINTKTKFSDDHTNTLQFICGDHAYRVMLNKKRIDAGIKHWNKFFIKKSKIKQKRVNNDS